MACESCSKGARTGHRKAVSREEMETREEHFQLTRVPVRERPAGVKLRDE